MKDRVLRLSALLLVIWYCFSIVGFGIHTCQASEKSFVATFISGLTCADIHPDHKCDKGHCCPHEAHDCCEDHAHEVGCCDNSADEDMSLRAPSCCSNDYHALVITGCETDNEDRSSLIQSESAFSVADVVSHEFHSNTSSKEYLYKPDSGPRLNADIQSLLSIWRI